MFLDKLIGDHFLSQWLVLLLYMPLFEGTLPTPKIYTRTYEIPFYNFGIKFDHPT